MIREKYRKLKPRLEATAHKIGDIQAKIFLTLFYYTVVPIVFLYLKSMDRIHHEQTGYFRTERENQNEIERHRKQF
jgi:hypothetical protein